MSLFDRRRCNGVAPGGRGTRGIMRRTVDTVFLAGELGLPEASSLSNSVLERAAFVEEGRRYGPPAREDFPCAPVEFWA